MIVPDAPSPALAAFVRARELDVVARAAERPRRGTTGPAASGTETSRCRALLARVADALEGIPDVGGDLRAEAAAYARERLGHGFGAVEVASELCALRDAVVELRSERGSMTDAEWRALARACDAVLAASLREIDSALAQSAAEGDEANARLEALFESAPVGIGFWDRDLRFVRVNRWLAELNGLPRDAHIGRTARELLPGVDAIADMEPRWKRMLETGERWTGAELTGETPAAPGVRRSWSEDFFPVRSRGRIVGLGAVVVETTEQRQAEGRLRFLARVSHELSETIEDEAATAARVVRVAVPDVADFCALVVADEGGPVRFVAVEALDPARAARARRILERLAAGGGADAEAAAIGRVLREGTPDWIRDVDSPAVGRAESPRMRKVARALGLRSYVAVPLLARARVSGAIAFGTAESGRLLDDGDLEFAQHLARRSAIALDNARLFEEARAEARARERILAIVSHDLRNPLSTVTLSAANLHTAPVPGPEGVRVARAAGAIRRAAERMRRLIGDLLDSAALERGQLSVSPSPLAPLDLVREAADSARALARERELELEQTSAPDLPDVLADHDRILQVLGNLLGNAVKATEPGGRVGIRAAAAEGEVVFSVWDTGPGIPDADRAHVFEPFRRGSGANYGGTGLGLAIARGIVEAHGGRIWLETEVGAGTRVSFVLRTAVSTPRAADAGAGAPI